MNYQRVVVTGSLGYDYIMDFPGRFADRIMPDKIHQISLSFLVDKLEKQFGGTAGNIAYTLNLLAIEPLIVSAAGNDFAPYKKFLLRQGIDIRFIRVFRSVATGAYFVVTDQEDNQIGSFYIGASQFNRQLTLPAVANLGMVVVTANDPQAMVRYYSSCQKRKLRYLFDPAFQIDNLSCDELAGGIEGAEIFIGNDYEIALVEKKLGWDHERLAEAVDVLITTFGSKGSLVEAGGLRQRIGVARTKNTSDPTGAGDAYRAGFLAGYLRNLSLKVCGQMGAVAAAYTVEKYGTQTHRFTLSQFKRRYKEAFGETLPL